MKSILQCQEFIMTRIYNDKNDMRALNSVCDTFILGSDQVLRYDHNDSAQYYVGMDFLNDDKKKIAYSSGMGHFEYLGNEWARINLSYFLSKFDYVALREPSTVGVAYEQFGVNAINVVDPIYFIEREDYENLAKQTDEPLELNEYILAFILTPDKGYVKELNELSRRMNLDVIVMAEYWNVDILKEMGFKNVIAPSVESWINHIINAKIIITDSFHAVYPFLTLRKQFLLVVNNNIDFKRGMARFPIFERIPELKERFVYDVENITTCEKLLEPINFDAICSVFDKEKEFSLQWLKNALFTTKTENKLTNDKSLKLIHDRLNCMHSEINDIVSDKINAHIFDKIKELESKLDEIDKCNASLQDHKFSKAVKRFSNFEKIFSIKNVYTNNVKRKVFTVLGIKFKFRVADIFTAGHNK